jgi:hypothetical protein
VSTKEFRRMQEAVVQAAGEVFLCDEGDLNALAERIPRLRAAIKDLSDLIERKAGHGVRP